MRSEARPEWQGGSLTSCSCVALARRRVSEKFEETEENEYLHGWDGNLARFAGFARDVCGLARTEFHEIFVSRTVAAPPRMSYCERLGARSSGLKLGGIHEHTCV